MLRVVITIRTIITVVTNKDRFKWKRVYDWNVRVSEYKSFDIIEALFYDRWFLLIFMIALITHSKVYNQ